MLKLLAVSSLLLVTVAVIFRTELFEKEKEYLVKYISPFIGFADDSAGASDVSNVDQPETLIQPKVSEAGVRLFTKDELKKYAGGDILYLAILGRVFDVSSGAQHYGKDGGYGFFAGIDGTRAYVSGDFTEKGLVENTEELTYQDILGIHDWMTFYDTDYGFIGNLIGLYYNERGEPTEEFHNWEKKLEDARAKKRLQEDDDKMFPSCNSQYNQKDGTHVWCSDMSGGIKRSWDGVPRKYFNKPGKDSTHRCACIRTSGPPSDDMTSTTHKDRGDLDNPRFQEYEGCSSTSKKCQL